MGNPLKRRKTYLKHYVYSIVSGIFLACAYPPMPASLVFAAVLGLSLLLYSLQSVRSIWHYFAQAFLAMLVWNVLTIYWIVNSTMAGGIFTIIANSLLYTFPFWVWYWARKLYPAQAWLLFICAFLGFEFFHFHWEIHFPWLTLGHALASTPELIQWYSFTGVAGGSLWLLSLSVLLLYLVNNPSCQKYRIALAALILVPALISLGMRYQVRRELETLSPAGQILIVQPNIEAYTEKFTLPATQQLEKMFQLCEAKIDSQTRYLVFPETALPELYWEGKDSIMNSQEATRSLQLLLAKLQKYPQLHLITGLSSYRTLAANARDLGKRHILKSPTDTLFYASYNTVASVNSRGFQDYYHKSKLVPGVESVPYAKYLGFMQRFTIDLGGITGSLGMDSSAHNLALPPYTLSALICYESIYGDYVSEFCRQGSDAICIITNDGWWGNTSGYRQHAQYGVLRAIENRKYVYRSANTGISYVCDPSGEILNSLPYEQAGVIPAAFYPLKYPTFYMRYPLVIYASASVILGIWGIFMLARAMLKKVKK